MDGDNKGKMNIQKKKSKTLSDLKIKENPNMTNHTNMNVTVLTNVPNDVFQHHMFTYLTDINLVSIGATTNERMSTLSKQCLQGNFIYLITR